MDAKISQVNKKLLRTFQKLSYKVIYDEEAQQIVKLNCLVGHVYRLFVQRQLQTASTFSGKLQLDSKNDLQLSKVIKQSHQHTIGQCCDKVTELADLFLMLINVMNKGNQKGLKNCLFSIQTMINQLQECLLMYQPKQKITKNRMQELKKISLKSKINIVQIPNDIVLRSPINSLQSYKQHFSRPHPIQSSNSDIVQDLKDQIQSLNIALFQNNKQYNIKLHAYTQQISLLQNQINQMNKQMYHFERNQRNYLNQLSQLKNQKIQDDILIKSMARKIRQFQQNSKYQSNYPKFNSRGGARFENHMCPILTRQKRINSRQKNSRPSSNQHESIKSSSRPISFEQQNIRNRIPSIKKKIRLQTIY